ncbi:unnamed protein product [Rotaria sordida]|uniref:Uncharacterized protein n=1 Tax=Rotaria sordida TaxID=392033 RepID=A0A818VXT3_9BILA|nr:unnamed protein product [Rotaria sordida]CAF3717467.1 unnamed protein product [Rotaria sordida]
MVGTYDTEEQRIIDRIKCIAFREARDAGATFINRHWIVKKNDRIWAKSADDIEEDERYRETVKNQPYIGIFVMSTAKRLHLVIKDKGETWTENVIDPDEVIFIHDKAPCMRAYQTQHLLQDNDVKFWSNDIWPGNLPDLNVAEHIGRKIKDEVEKKMLSEPEHSRYLE